MELRRRIDSLNVIQLPTQHLVILLDSLEMKKDRLIADIEARKTTLLAKTKGRIDEWSSLVKKKISLNTLPGNSSLSTVNEKVSSELQDLHVHVPKIDLPDIPSLNIEDFSDLHLTQDLSSINKSLSSNQLDAVKDVQGKLGSVTGELSQVKTLSKDPDQAIETSLKEVAQVKQVQDQIDIAGEMENNELVRDAKKLENPGQIIPDNKESLIKAIDHFAGKEENIQKAMESVSKYKQKFATVSNLNDLPKKRPNPMKAKPLIERIIPGIAFQLQKKNDDILTDVSVYFGYRITQRFTSGVGWNQRVGYNIDHYTWNSQQSNIYGPRIYSEYRLSNGFFPRIELEAMNTFVPPYIKTGPVDPGGREWVGGAFVGMKKEYKLLKNVKGTAIVMLRLFDPERKSPYADVVNARFGFEFPMKKRVRAGSVAGR